MIKKKLLLISPIFVSKDQKGHAPFMKNMLDAYIRNGLEVDIIVKRGRNQFLFQKILTYALFYLKILFKNTRKYDIVQISFPTLVYPIIALKDFGQAKIFVRFHGEDLVIPKNSKLRSFLIWFSRQSIKMCDLVVVPSKYFSDIVKEIEPSAKIYIYPSGGVDLNKFFPKVKQAKDAGIICLGYVGRLSIEKGLDVLIDAISVITEYKIRLHIIGDGPDKVKLLNYATTKNIDFKYHGSVSNDQLVQFYNLFDLFVFPTTRLAESFGNVGVEAMACGKPVVGANIGGISEYLTHDYNGFLFEAGNSDDLARKILKYISLNDIEKDIMRLNALKTSRLFETDYLTKNFIKYLIKL